MESSVQKILDDNGVDAIKFYYHNSPLVSNAFTTCILLNSSKPRIESRGVSICSLKDTYCKSEGKNKAFGRAIAALVHRKSKWKINGSSRDDEFVTRSCKIKSSDSLERFRTEVANELKSIDPQIPITVTSNSGKAKKYSFPVPLSYPIRLANSFFRYKSQYRPVPVNEEERSVMHSIESSQKEIKEL